MGAVDCDIRAVMTPWLRGDAREARGDYMFDRQFMLKILCAGLVAGIMLPVGTLLFPYVSSALDHLQFQALEAVLATTLGFMISTLFG